MADKQHADFLSLALTEAKRHMGNCAPNPAVGAIISLHNEVIGRGCHEGPGRAHAEIVALQSLAPNQNLSAAVLYVTLEPCCHYGRTPPCTNAIIASGIRKVVFAFRDPNPCVDGGGQAALEAAGIDCEHISLAEIDDFYRSYQYWTCNQLPYLINKIGNQP